MTQPAGEPLPLVVDAAAASILAQVTAAEQQLADQLARVARHGLRDTTGADQLAMLAEMRRVAQRISVQLRLRLGPLAQQIIATAGREGEAAAVAAIARAIRGHARLAERYLARSALGASGHGLAAANAIALDLTSRLEAAALGIVRFADDAYRATVADAATRLVLGREGLTPASTQHRAWGELARAGVTGYTDTAGRRWNLATYTEMATRTAVQRAYNASHEQRMTSVGIEYFTISHDGRPCPLCAPWEGAILSNGVTGRVSELAADSDRRVTFTVAATLAEARAAGLFHPNCKHVVLLYLPGVTRLAPRRAWTADDQARYDATQQLRQLERQVRAWKREQAAALDDLQRQRAARKVRELQARIRAHVAEHDLVRRPRREQLDLGNH